MGLDNRKRWGLNRTMNIKLLLAKFGLGSTERKEEVRIKRISPMARERMQFEDEAKEQFQALKKKGLSIPVFTL